MTQQQDTLPRRPAEASGGEQWIQFIPSPKWVRVVFGGEVIADSVRVRMLRESRRTPIYYFPVEDVREGVLLPSDHTTESPLKGTASYFTVKVSEKMAEDAAWTYREPLPEAAEMKGYVAFEWGKMDAWFEEREEVYIHPRDPYKRVDVLESSRHVRVVVGGETVAETHNPVLLFETGLPTRYYIPKVDLRMDLLVPSERATYCPYKGQARYYSVAAGDRVHTDIAWYYTYPTTESSKIAGLVSFYNEWVDELYVDGELQPKPRTRWS